MSHLKQQISIQVFVRDRVMALLGWDELAYNEYQMAQGMAYLDEQLGEDKIGKKLAENALYWAWWRNHWHDVDMEFIYEVKNMTQQERRLYYECQHDYKAFEYKPQRIILQDAIEKIKKQELIKHTL
jgi:hypothetical protein